MQPSARKNQNGLLPPPPSVSDEASESASWPAMKGLPERPEPKPAPKTLKMRAVPPSPEAKPPPLQRRAPADPGIPTEISQATALFDDMLADVSAPVPVGSPTDAAATDPSPPQPDMAVPGDVEPTTAEPEDVTELEPDVATEPATAEPGPASTTPPVLEMQAGVIPHAVEPEQDAESWFRPEHSGPISRALPKQQSDARWTFGVGGLVLGTVLGVIGGRLSVDTTDVQPAPAAPQIAAAVPSPAAPPEAPTEPEGPAPSAVPEVPTAPDDGPPPSAAPETPTVVAAPELPAPAAAPEPAPAAVPEAQAPAAPAPPSEPAPAGDARTPPAGTSPEAAEAFAKLPVRPEDRPPVGGIGPDGTHIDRLVVGDEDGKGACGDARTQFSIEAGDRVYACFRIVHPVEGEKLTVRWRKDGNTRRRSFFNMTKTVHATRQRAHMTVREGYEGSWSVHVLASDGTELASSPFTITP